MNREFENAALPCRGEILRAALALLRNHGDAEDLTQDVYLEAWKSFHRFEPGTNCRAWLFQILFHRLWHHRRKSRRMVAMDLDEHPFKNLPAREPVPETLTDKRLLGALDEIPRSYRDAVLMSDVEDLSYREIADRLRTPLGTVMSRLSRGRAMLREQLGGAAARENVVRGIAVNDDWAATAHAGRRKAGARGAERIRGSARQRMPAKRASLEAFA